MVANTAAGNCDLRNGLEPELPAAPDGGTTAEFGATRVLGGDDCWICPGRGASGVAAAGIGANGVAAAVWRGAGPADRLVFNALRFDRPGIEKAAGVATPESLRYASTGRSSS